MKTVKAALSFAGAIFALIAAGLWYQSSVVKVKPEDHKGEGMKDFQIIENGNDILNTAKAQALWSKRAALAAFLSAFFQGVVLLIPDSN